MKVLVAEGNDAYRMMLSQILEKEGHEVHNTSDGIDALKLYAKDEDVQMVFADWEIPGIDGLELTKRIRHVDGVRGSPSYIILTADRGGKWDLMMAMETGANDMITKPYTEDVVQDRLTTGIMHFLKPEGEAHPLTNDPIAHLLEEHKILRFQAEKLDSMLERIDEEADEALVKWLGGRSFVLETEVHQEKENLFSIAFLERLTRAQGEAARAISDSSAEWVAKEHGQLQRVVETVRDNYREYLESLDKDPEEEDKEFNIMEHTEDYPAYCLKCEKKVAIAGPALFRMENGTYAFKGQCAECGTGVTTIIGKSIGSSQKNIRLKRSLKKYLEVLKEHLAREEKAYFPLVDKYFTQADRERLMQDFEGVEKKFGLDRIGKEFKFIE